MFHKSIKFIFFDLGGVVIQDFSGTNKWDEMLSDLGINMERKEGFKCVFNRYVGDLSKGTLDSFEIIKKIEKELVIQFPENYNLVCDFVMRFEANRNLEIVLKELKKEYKIGLLTNMYPGMFGKIKEQGILPNIEWDIVIDSSIVGMKKPDENIYIYAEKSIGLKGSDILFIDNLEENIISAKKLGWNALLYNPRDTTTSNKVILDFLQHVH